MDGTEALDTLEDSVCVLRFVKPSYESDVTGLHHELLDVYDEQYDLKAASRLHHAIASRFFMSHFFVSVLKFQLETGPSSIEKVTLS